MDLEVLKSEFQKDNYLMPTLDDFNKRIEILFNIWNPKNDNKINYLIGKGIAVELALRGKIDRESRKITFSYRKHYDLELYIADEQVESKENYKNFQFVFGNQEVLDTIKSLHNLPNDLLFNSSEKVIYNLHEYYIPELELLFLDKFLRVEENARIEGYDYLLLLKKYKLNLEKVLNYFDKYYLEPIVNAFDEGYKNLVNDQINGLVSLARMVASDSVLENGEFEVRRIIKYINEKIEVMKKENISFFGLKGNLLEYNPPIKFINEEFVLNDENYLEKINKNVTKLKETEEKTFLDKKDEIIRLFKNIYE